MGRAGDCGCHCETDCFGCTTPVVQGPDAPFRVQMDSAAWSWAVPALTTTVVDPFTMHMSAGRRWFNCPAWHTSPDFGCGTEITGDGVFTDYARGKSPANIGAANIGWRAASDKLGTSTFCGWDWTDFETLETAFHNSWGLNMQSHAELVEAETGPPVDPVGDGNPWDYVFPDYTLTDYHGRPPVIEWTPSGAFAVDGLRWSYGRRFYGHSWRLHADEKPGGGREWVLRVRGRLARSRIMIGTDSRPSAQPPGSVVGYPNRTFLPPAPALGAVAPYLSRGTIVWNEQQIPNANLGGSYSVCVLMSYARASGLFDAAQSLPYDDYLDGTTLRFIYGVDVVATFKADIDCQNDVRDLSPFVLSFDSWSPTAAAATCLGWSVPSTVTCQFLANPP